MKNKKLTVEKDKIQAKKFFFFELLFKFFEVV